MSNPEKFSQENLASENKKRTLAREEFEREFDETKGDLRKRIGEQEYEQLKKDWVDKRMEEADDIEDANQGREEAIEGRKKDRIDSVTGLERREEMYKLLHKKTVSLLNIKDPEKMSGEQLFEELKQEDRDFEDRDLFVMMADVSYLGLVNKLGHKQGDKLLEEAGGAAGEVGIRAFRHGGDEISGLLEADEQQVHKRVEKLKSVFADSEIKDSLAKHFKVEPHLDTGVAKFSEGFRVFKEVINTKEGEEYLEKKSPLKELQDIWVEIADKKSFINKAVARTEVLSRKYDSDKDNYHQIVSALSKGSDDLTVEEIESFVGKSREEIREYILNKKRDRLGEFEGYERVKEEAILDLIEQKI